MKVIVSITQTETLELDIQIPDNVFHPSFMSREVLKAVGMVGLKPTETILDLGTGTGIVALALYKVGYKNISVSDLLESTVSLAKQNFKDYNFTPQKIYESDMFKNIDEKFDLIITNPPAYPYNSNLKKNKGLDISIYSGEDGREFLQRFLQEVSNYLNPNGRFLMSVPSFLDWNYVDDLLRNNKLESREITSERCELPNYGYPPKKFIANFLKTYNVDFYKDRSPQKHHWVNVENENIEFKVKTICGWSTVKKRYE